MGLVRDHQDLRRMMRVGRFLAEFAGAEMVSVDFLTDPKAVAAVLPPPLRPAPEPVATAFVARYPETNFGVSYNEGALFVQAAHRGELGLYCLAMPVDDDTAMICGREQYGFPKKMADINLDRNGSHVVGSVVRNDVEILRIEGEFVDEHTPGTRPVAEPAFDLEGRPCQKLVVFLFKHFLAADGGAFETAPRLIRQVNFFRPRPGMLTGAGKLELGSSTTDPLGEIPVRTILGASYGTYDNTMLPGRVIRRIHNPLRFAPYSMSRYDVLALVDLERMPELTWTQRLRQHRRLRSY